MRHPGTDPDVIIFGFIIVVVGFVVILIGTALGLWPLPFNSVRCYHLTRETARAKVGA